MREQDQRYFDRIERELDEAFEVAETAKQRGGDPEPEVEIPTARDMAARVENILGIDGVAERVRELEGEMSREEAALELVTDFVDGEVGDYSTTAGKIEGATRTAVALLTEGVVAAPIEGIDRVEVNENDDGTEYAAVYYAGPIRSAGGTAQALSVLVADYARTLLDVDEFKPRDDEIERYAEEVDLYDSETGLQYSPKDKETKFITEHCPIMLDGEATGDEEVSGFRDLERIDTNSARGGMCLVLAEGIALKAPKIQRYTRNLDEVEWPWLQDLIDGTIGKEDGDEEVEGDGQDDADSEEADEEGDDADEDDGSDGPPRVEPNGKFLRDLIAGRPVFTHPSAQGGFRLRYGRSRNLGVATAGVHPATMHLVDDFLAPGTQIKTELPGKAAGVVPVTSIEGPMVRLANGDVRRIDDAEEALAVRNGVEKILDLGEYLVNYGEFIENNHPLVPGTYAPEWWLQEFEAAGGPRGAIEDDPTIDVERPDVDQALEWAAEYDVALHPEYTYCWHDIDVEAFRTLADAVENGRIVTGDGALSPPEDEDRTDRSSDGASSAEDRQWSDHGEFDEGDLVLADSDGVRAALETILVEHSQNDGRIVVPTWRPLVRSLGFDDDLQRPWEALPEEACEWPNAMKAVNAVAPFAVRERSPTRVGNRMGRPEKSEDRELSPAVHTLFPINEAGGSQRDVAAAAGHAETMSDTPGELDVQVGVRHCPDCGLDTYESRCPECGDHLEPDYWCPECDQSLEPDESGRVVCNRCEVEGTCVEYRTIDLKTEYRDALDAVGERENAFDVLKGVKGLSSATKTPEPIEKGILRAKHDVSAFKDGTVRYDMTDLPITSVKPGELDVTADQLRQLGYEEDIHGDPLRHDDQVVELKVQDVVLSDGAAEHMLRTADFIDDLLESYYGMDSYYDLDDRDDLVGELVFGMAPHTSAAVVGRVIGFSSVAGGYAHPFFHAAKRRNCDGDEDCVMLLMDGLLNFSKSYLPDQRGGSVADGSRLVAVDPHGNVRFLTIEELWSELDTEVIREGKFYKKPCEQEGWRTYAFDDQHRSELQPIEKAIRYRADEDERLLRISTQFGRSVEITESHSLFRYGDDGIEAVAGSELSDGDLIVAPQQFDIETERTTIDVAGALEEPYVAIDDDIEGFLTNVWESTPRGGSVHSAFDSGLAYRLSKRKIGLNRLERIAAAANREPPLADASIALWGSERGIDPTIEVDEGFAWLLGAFVAEGSLSGTAPTLFNADESFVETVVERTRTSLGVDPTVEWSNKSYRVRFPTVFERVLFDLGFEDRTSYSSSEKVVPDPILTADRSVVIEFLRGLFEGDGSETNDDNHTNVNFHTTSEAVKDGVVFLLHRLGLVANVSRKERGESRQPIYTVTVGGGATDNPLRRIFDGADPYQPKSLVVRIPDALMELRESDVPDAKQIVPNYLKRRENVSLEKLEEMIEAFDERDLSPEQTELLDDLRPLVDGDLSYLRVQEIERVEYDGYLYDLQVGGEPKFVTEWLYAHNSMDAPLVMSSRIDPSEIDDEAHNVDVVDEYPLELYEAGRELADPEDVDLEIAEDTLGTDEEYTGFGHTHSVEDIAAGPDLSAYKTLGSMMEKMDAQLELSRKLEAVDETDVAERVIEYHFLPDLIGNLRAFSRQEVRCLDCGEKYRRMPLTGHCRALTEEGDQCGGDVNLTVHEGSVNKYMDTAIEVATEYGSRKYTKQRLEVLERALDRTFENDKNKASQLDDFM